MKKYMFTMIAALLMSSAAFAQNDKKECKCGDQKDKKEMVQHRTDKMVKKYALDEKQAAQLLELNTKYAGKMEPRGHRPHPGGKGGKKVEKKTDAETGATAQQPQERKRPEITEEQKAKFEAMRKEAEATRKAYDAELEKILTADQFQQYQADQKKHEGHGPKHGHHGPKRK